MPSCSYVKESRVQMNKSNQSLDNSLVKDILDYLDCSTKAPTLRYLNRLILAYIRKVPWESVSRIIKRHTTLETKNCPRLPKEFWIEAIQHGFGGTCFESSLAFYSLLTTLGYEGYLTVNDMGDSRGCHAAIVLFLDGQKYLVDITIPVHAAVRIDPQKTVRRKTAMFDYTLYPVSENKYEVGRSHRSTKNLFTLVDVPVRLPAYIATVEDDYKETTGRFLNSVVMVKVIDGRAQRFFSDQKPYKLECLDRASRIEKSIEPEILPLFLAELFQIPEESISTAFSLIQDPTATVVVPALLQERIGQHA
jgi:arylamine N-acetyltransferase